MNAINESLIALKNVKSLKEYFDNWLESNPIKYTVAYQNSFIKMIRKLRVKGYQSNDIISSITPSELNKLGIDLYYQHAKIKPYLFELDYESFIDGLIRKDGKVKLFIDTFNGEWKQSWQTPKETSKGFYVKLYGERTYLTNI